MRGYMIVTFHEVTEGYRMCIMRGYMIFTFHEVLKDSITSREVRWARRVADMGAMLIAY
jgi:hypothetical protein